MPISPPPESPTRTRLEAAQRRSSARRRAAARRLSFVARLAAAFAATHFALGTARGAPARLEAASAGPAA